MRRNITLSPELEIEATKEGLAYCVVVKLGMYGWKAKPKALNGDWMCYMVPWIIHC